MVSAIFADNDTIEGKLSFDIKSAAELMLMYPGENHRLCLDYRWTHNVVQQFSHVNLMQYIMIFWWSMSCDDYLKCYPPLYSTHLSACPSRPPLGASWTIALGADVEPSVPVAFTPAEQNQDCGSHHRMYRAEDGETDTTEDQPEGGWWLIYPSFWYTGLGAATRPEEVM